MSKIIKAFPDASIPEYDFQVLDGDPCGDSTPKTYVAKDFGSQRATRNANTFRDPLDEIEATVQTRLLELERRSQEIEQEAYEKGYAQGERDGYEVGKKSMLILKDRLERLVERLESLPEKVFADYRDWFVSTSMEVARKIVGIELETKPLALTRLVDALLDEAQAHHSLTLTLHPKDMELLGKHIDLRKWSREGKHPFMIKNDSGLERGGCRIESDFQVIDATLETQFSQIKEALLEGESAAED